MLLKSYRPNFCTNIRVYFCNSSYRTESLIQYHFTVHEMHFRRFKYIITAVLQHLLYSYSNHHFECAVMIFREYKRSFSIQPSYQTSRSIGSFRVSEHIQLRIYNQSDFHRTAIPAWTAIRVCYLNASLLQSSVPIHISFFRLYK